MSGMDHILRGMDEKIYSGIVGLRKPGFLYRQCRGLGSLASSMPVSSGAEECQCHKGPGWLVGGWEDQGRYRSWSGTGTRWVPEPRVLPPWKLAVMQACRTWRFPQGLRISQVLPLWPGVSQLLTAASHHSFVIRWLSAAGAPPSFDAENAACHLRLATTY
ncbi:hypothetical protein GQ53DRAFT_287628 [Thozetella sp. PMI_491]|nr:hypothetical protein GQ53DRAFT_287628 [Thozetella sp. PMI_491]